MLLGLPRSCSRPHAFDVKWGYESTGAAVGDKLLSLNGVMSLACEAKSRSLLISLALGIA